MGGTIAHVEIKIDYWRHSYERRTTPDCRALKLADDAIAKAKAELEAARELKRSLLRTLFCEGPIAARDL